MKRSHYNKIIKYNITSVCTSPLHIGSSVGGKEEVLTHPTDNKPFIQASSIAGVLRNTFADIYAPEKMAEVFGDQEQNSKIKISDGEFVDDSIMMEIRPHVRIDRKTGSVSSADKNGSGQKFEMEYIGVGTSFTWQLYLFVDENTGSEFVQEMESVLACMKQGILPLGAKKSNGVGFNKITELGKIVFDMKNKEHRNLWKKEESLSEEHYENYLEKLDFLFDRSSTRYAYHVSVSCQTESALQVKGIAVSDFSQEAADSENQKNALGEYIIPGSSLKGTVRSRMEKIAAYLGKENLVENAFGIVADDGGQGKQGNLICHDTSVNMEKQKVDIIRNRIHIDKITGGVMHGQLFTEKNICGNMNMTFDILNDENADRTMALLLFALRDMAAGLINIGNGYATGKGFVKISSIRAEAFSEMDNANGELPFFEIEYEKETADKATITDLNHILDKLMGSIKGE